MNLLNSVNNFYNNLSSDGLFFFWIIAFLFVFLIIITIALIIKNKKLIKLLKNEKEVSYEELPIIKNEENNIVKVEEKNTVVKENIENNEVVTIEKESSEEAKESDNTIEELKVEIKKELDLPREETNNKVNNSFEENKGAYRKNVLREMSKKMPTSPIHIEKSHANENVDIVTISNDKNYDYDLKGIDYHEDYLSPLEQMEDLYESNDSMDFANEIVKKMEDEVKPSNIELTEYEKKQEEEAIISYDELLKVKDKIYNLTEEEENEEFLDELKTFRLDLE